MRPPTDAVQGHARDGDVILRALYTAPHPPTQYRVMFDLRPLRHFIRIVDLGSLSRAAQEVGIAQPALSQHVAALEADFGIKLLNRGPQGAKPTEAGMTLYRYAQLLLRQMDEARQAVRSEPVDIRGTVAIGLSLTTAEMLSLPILNRVMAELPHVHMQIVSLPNRLLVEMLMNSRLDMAILFDQRPCKGIKPALIAVEEMFFLTSKKNGARVGRTAATLNEVSRYPLLLPCRPHGVRALLEAALTRNGHNFQVIAELDAVPSLIEAVEAGMGATVLPWSAFYRYAARGRIAYKPFAERLEREISFCISDVSPLTIAAAAARQVIENVILSLIASGEWRGLVPRQAGSLVDGQARAGIVAVPARGHK